MLVRRTTRPQVCSNLQHCGFGHEVLLTRRHVSGNNGSGNQQGPFFTRLRVALRDTKVQWYNVPISAGIACVLAVHGYRKYREVEDDKQVVERKPDVRPDGPWQVRVLSSLPLNSISRLWGYLNEIKLPIWMRPPGYKLYAWIFGCNLDEIKEKDLTKYANLAEFFYRELEPGRREIANTAVVSPADGKVLHLGSVHDRQVEQVKGLTYSLDALIGRDTESQAEKVTFEKKPDGESDPGMESVSDREFAEVNGITYSLEDLIGSNKNKPSAVKVRDATDYSNISSTSALMQVVTEAGAQSLTDSGERRMFFAVVYLAPGDYHRFHSPVSWVVERRRHFAGDLFSVSPYVATRLANLFVLNERVALLGRYRWGFFSMTPVGATNVGSIRIHFDKFLKTNTMNKEKPKDTYAEATYFDSSLLLRGHPLSKGQEIGGFCLGSTIVLVFEAPPNFHFLVQPGDHVKVGQAFGDVA